MNKRPPLKVTYASFAPELDEDGNLRKDEDADESNDGTHEHYSSSMAISWGAEAFGFGQLYFYVDDKDHLMHCSNEFMSRDSIKKILDKMVDDCVLDDTHDENNSFSTDNFLPIYPKVLIRVSDGEGGIYCELKNDEDRSFLANLVKMQDGISIVYKDIKGHVEEVLTLSYDERTRVGLFNERYPDKDSRIVFQSEGAVIKNKHYEDLIAVSKSKKGLVCFALKTDDGKVQFVIQAEQAEMPF